MGDLSKRVVAITGASSGIGAATAEVLAAEEPAWSSVPAEEIGSKN